MRAEDARKTAPRTAAKPVRVKQRLGKYRVERKLGEGGFAAVFQALDTVEGVRVALKVPHPRLINAEVLDDFRREVRIAARLKHPKILSLKNAERIGEHFVVAFPLGESTLEERLRRRLSLATALDYAEQLLEAAAHAHAEGVIHCDIKPENVILFPDGELTLTDFGIAKVALKTIRASGSGTVGYVAPEQAMGKPSFRSDVFSIGLILYRMLSGRLPEWPFEWPPPGAGRLRQRVHPDLVEVVRRAIAVDARKRYRDASRMLAALRHVRKRALRHRTVRQRRSPAPDWRTLQRRQFVREHGRDLELRHTCRRCEGPVAEAMCCCPWCGAARKAHDGTTSFPQACPRCKRGMKLDWSYCPWCFGAGFEVRTNRRYADARYTARCRNARCERKSLMPFMRYCPWCRSKVQKRWKIPSSRHVCPSCGWGVVRGFWSHCAWCARPLRGASGR